jgi:hypothetical protein
VLYPIRVDHSIKVSVIEWTSLAYIESNHITGD